MDSHLRDMVLFVAIARAGSLTRASQTLGIPLSSLSRRFAQFERTIGLQLINRDTRRLQLTSVGREYLIECEALVNAARVAHERLRHQRDEPEGCLKLSMTPDFGVLQFSTILVEFAQRYPAIRFDLDLTSETMDLIAEGIDVAIRFGMPADSSLTMRSLGTIQHGVYAAPAYLAQHGTPLLPRDLKRHAGIRLSHATKARYDRMSQGGRFEAIVMTERFRTNNLSLIRNLAIAGLGVAIMPAVMGQEGLRSGALLQLLPDWSFEPTPVIALTPTRLLPAKCRVFLEFVAARSSQIFSHEASGKADSPKPA